MIVVARAGLGTLNHTALTVEAIKRRGVTCLGIMIGSWPRDPDLAAQCNLEDLSADRAGPREDSARENSRPWRSPNDSRHRP